MDWRAFVLPVLSAIVVTLLTVWLRDRLPSRLDKQTWWEREVNGLRQRVESLEKENALLKERVSKVEDERNEALIKLAQAIIHRDEAQAALDKLAGK